MVAVWKLSETTPYEKKIINRAQGIITHHMIRFQDSAVLVSAEGILLDAPRTVLTVGDLLLPGTRTPPKTNISQ